MEFLKKLKIGEGLLWIAFVFFVMASDNHKVDDAVTLAGICALAAIGVRATRVEKPEER